MIHTSSQSPSIYYSFSYCASYTDIVSEAVVTYTRECSRSPHETAINPIWEGGEEHHGTIVWSDLRRVSDIRVIKTSTSILGHLNLSPSYDDRRATAKQVAVARLNHFD